MKARFLALAALVLGLASCQNDFDGANAGAKGEVDFQLSVNAPELATRAGLDGQPDELNDLNSAYGAIDYLQGGTANDELRTDWSDVDLRYTLEVFDADVDYASEDVNPVKDRQVIIVDEYEPVVFDLRLVPKRNYRFVVFADFVPQGATDDAKLTTQRELGLHHIIGNDLRDITVKNDGINDECSDAYFATKDIIITNSASNDIVLKRPYGKLRVIATDLHELNLNVNPAAVKVEYTAEHVAGFNAVTGAVKSEQVYATKVYDSKYNEIYKEDAKGGLKNHFYTADYDALEGHKYTNANDVVRHTHMTLFTDYILASDQQHTVHFTMTVYDDKDMTSEIKSTTFNTDIPVQRNYLTTVIGNVLTTATEIEVRIDDNFAGEIPADNDVVFVSTAAALQEALDNFVNGQVILFENNIEGDVVVDQVEGKDYIIDGNGFEYDGTMTIDGNARNNGAETVLIQNINFVTDKSNHDFIQQNSTDGAVRYAHNVTIKNCSFNATGEEVVGMRFRQCYDIVVEDCVADGTTRAANASGLHSLAQLAGCKGVTIDGVDVSAKEGGVNLGTSTNVVIKNSTFVAEQYGIRADASVETALNIENVNITAKIPVIARYATGNYTINFSGNNNFEAPGYQVVLTNVKDDVAFVAPTGNYTLNGAEGLRVFPSDVLYAYNATDLQYLLDNAVAGNNNICFAANIEGDVTVYQIEGENITIDGREYKYDGTININGRTDYTSETLTIKNVNFETEATNRAFVLQYDQNGNARYPHNVTIEDCTFTGAGKDVVAVKFRAGKNIVIKNCTAEVGHSLAQFTGTVGVNIIENVTVKAGRGISFGTLGNFAVKNSTFDVESYGLRADASSEASLNLENVNITANIPVIARNASVNYTINFTGNNTLTTSGYQVVFTTGSDDKTFVAPAAYTLTGGDNFLVFPRDAADNNFIYNVDELQKALAAKKTEIVLQPGEYKGVFKPLVATTIKSANANNKAVIAGRFDFDQDCVVENIKFKVTNDSAVKKVFSGTNYQYPSTANIYAAAVSFEGCEFQSDIATGVCGINYGAHTAGKMLKVNNCKFEGDFYAIRSRTLFEITNNTFDVYTTSGKLAAVFTWGNSNSGANTVTFTGNRNANANEVYGVQLTSTTYTYDNITYNVQDNTGFSALKDAVNPACSFTNKTFADGSETF